MKIDHPLDLFFDIEPGNTDLTVPVPPPVALPVIVDENPIERKVDATSVDLDQEDRLEDIKNAEQLDTIQTAAMQAFYQQQAISQTVDPKFSARNSEVAAQFLKTALDAVNARSEAKYKRQKMRLATSTAGKPTHLQQNLIVADRNSLLKDLFSQDFEQTMKQQLARELSPHSEA